MRRNRTKALALSGLMAAAAVALLFAASVAPTGKLWLAAAAGVAVSFAAVECGAGMAALCYGASSLVGLLLLPNKGIALLFALVFGLYPLVKLACEKLPSRFVEWVLKLVYFNAALALCYGLALLFLLPIGIFSDPLYLLLGLAAANAVFIVYDLAFTRLISYYIYRLRKTR